MDHIPKELILKQMEIGPLANFLYFIGDAATNEIAVIDPAWDVNYLCEQAKRNNYIIKAVFLTHGHPDHVNGLADMLKRHNVPAYISRHEADYYTPVHPNLVTIEDGDTLTVGNLKFETILTPGHTPGCQCFRYKNVLIAGDTLFIDGCGRCDLPGGNAKTMYYTLYNIIKKLPDETIVFPGHNYGPVPYATIGEQKRTNPYLSCENLEEFLFERMGMG
jgi:hydroxyacylglutathione hydrolase